MSDSKNTGLEFFLKLNWGKHWIKPPLLLEIGLEAHFWK